MKYGTRAVADMLDWTPQRVRRFVNRGLVQATRVNGRFEFAFSDLVLFRTAHDLEKRSISYRKILRVMQTVKRQLPDGKALSTVRLAARGESILITEGNLSWESESGQIELQLDKKPQTNAVSNLASRSGTDDLQEAISERYNRAIDLESTDRRAAIQTYESIVRSDPGHQDALVNLGRLVQEDGDLERAREHYESALAADSSCALAQFNLGTLYEALRQEKTAIEYYELASNQLPDAHFNLAHMYERLGDIQRAIRHLRAYQMNSSTWQESDVHT